MTSHRLRFAIFGNSYQAKKSASISEIIAHLRNRGAEISMESEFFRFLSDIRRSSVEGIDKVFSGNAFTADFVISMGGDGTFLKAASRVADKRIPIVGVNMGRLGFLADVSPSEFEACLSSIYSGDYAVEKRTVMKVEAEGSEFMGPNTALNDVAILKRDNASMITIHASVDGQFLATYQADGLVVSTPTGSTAYSLSNGGPIIVPGTNVFSLTAVAPHSLSIRPIVIPDSCEISLRVECRSRHFLVAIDGRSEICREDTRLTITKAPYPIMVIKRKGMKYFSTLREKMMWGADPRQ